jgi:tetratricopeptide (TPR) repeat protein
LGRYDDAQIVYRDRLNSATLYRLSASRQRLELLAALFPNGEDALPRLSQPHAQAYTLNTLALAYENSGQLGRAVAFFRRCAEFLDEQLRDEHGFSVVLCNLADALRNSGRLHTSEAAARRALGIDRERHDEFREAVSLYRLGLARAARGRDGMTAQRRSLRILIAQSNRQGEGVGNAFLAGVLLWRGEFSEAQRYADRAWKLAQVHGLERDFIRAAGRQGEAALGLGDLAAADERLHHALTRARAVNLVEEELPALIGLAELARRRGDPTQAREHLDGVWELAERGPYPLFHADALNVLAQIERDASNTKAAIDAATKAYTLAWCDGISADGKECYAYWWGLQAAKAHLDALGAPTPVLPPFDPDNFEPMPEVEIDPQDEYNTEGWVPYADEEES